MWQLIINEKFDDILYHLPIFNNIICNHYVFSLFMCFRSKYTPYIKHYFVQYNYVTFCSIICKYNLLFIDSNRAGNNMINVQIKTIMILFISSTNSMKALLTTFMTENCSWTQKFISLILWLSKIQWTAVHKGIKANPIKAILQNDFYDNQ